MLKKILVLSALLAAANPANASVQAHPYLGAGLGVQNTEAYNGLMATVFGGYSLTTGTNHSYYFAGELFGDSGSLPLGQNYYRRTNYGFGASFIPGIFLRDNILLYLRMGVETFRYSTTLQMFTGGQLGLGLQTSISECWDIRGEYVYTGAGVFHSFGISRFNFFKLGFIYNFK